MDGGFFALRIFVVTRIVWMKTVHCALRWYFRVTFFLRPLFAPAAFIPSSIFSKTLGTPTNLAMSRSKWSKWQKLFHWKIINCNCNLLGLKCLMFSRRVPLSAFLSAKQQVPPFKSSLLDASQIVHKLWEQLPVWPPLTWSRRHPSSGQPHGRGEGRREPIRLHNPSRTNLCSSLQCMSPG